MLLLSTDILPEGFNVREVFSMVQLTMPIEVLGARDKSRNKYQEALDRLQNLAPQNANAIIGIKATTCAQQVGDTTVMFLTYIGTPIRYGKAAM